VRGRFASPTSWYSTSMPPAPRSPPHAGTPRGGEGTVARERKRAEREGNKVGEAEYSRWIHTQGGGGVRLGTVRLVGQGAAGRPDSELALGWSHSVGSQN
jgi:hypothetical protein